MSSFKSMVENYVFCAFSKHKTDDNVDIWKYFWRQLVLSICIFLW